MNTTAHKVLEGYIDGASRDHIYGWMRDTRSGSLPLALLVSIDDLTVVRIIADRERADLTAAGIGRHAFDLRINEPLSPMTPHLVRIIEEETGEECPGSPRIVPTAIEFDAAVEGYFAAILGDFPNEAELRRRLHFLRSQERRLSNVMRRQSEGAPTQKRDETALTRVPDRTPGGGRRSLNVLVIDETLPRFNHDAGSSAILSHCSAMRSLGLRVTLAAANMTGKLDVSGSSAAGVTVAASPEYASIEELFNYNSGQYDVIYFYRCTTIGRYLPLARHHFPKSRLIYSVADLHHLRWGRQALIENRHDVSIEIDRMKRSEFSAAAIADLVITHSSVEAVVLQSAIDNDSKVIVVPWHIPLQPGPNDFDSRDGVAFVGHYGHAANLAAAVWLADEIMPKVRESDPTIRCTLIGSDMPDVLRRPRTGVAALGAVPVLSNALARTRITVAPLTYGAGLKGKVLDSLGLGIPCVCTPVAAEGIPLGPALSSLVSSGVDGMAAAILRVYFDENLYLECRREGLDLVSKLYSEERIVSLLKQGFRTMGLRTEALDD